MSYVKKFIGEVKQYENCKIRFEASGFSNFTDDIVIELSKVPKDGFEETGPCELVKKLIKIPHIHFLLYRNMLITIGYSYHPFDYKNNPHEKVYYKCYRHFLHHDDIMLRQYERFISMNINEVVDFVITEKWDMQIN